MNTFASRALMGVLFTGGLMALGAGAAHAADATTTGEDGILSGTQAVIDVDLPVSISGSGISILGDSSSSGSTRGGAAAPAPAPAPAPASAPAASTGGDDSLLGGTQGLVDIDVPITVSGNSVSVLGDSSSQDSSTGGSAAGSGSGSTGGSTSGDDGVAGGTQVIPVVDAPVNVSGNAISVLGDSSSEGSSSAVNSGSGTAGTGAGGTTSGDEGILGGTQVLGDIDVPIDLSGNAISVLGDSSSTGSTTGTGTSGTGSTGGTTGGTTSGDDGILGGTQVIPVVGLPVGLGGNAISVIGDSSTEGSTTGTGTTGGATGGTTSGDDGILGGTQVTPVVDLPVGVGGNAISVIGDSSSEGSTSGTGTTGTTGGATGGTTSGDDGILGGTQVTPVVDLPIGVGGNAISVIGDSSSEGSTSGTGTTGTGATGGTTSGDDGILGGTQVTPVVDLPVGVGGNAISVIGDSSSEGSTSGTGTTGTTGGATGGTTSGDDGILGGTQVTPVVDLPVGVGGNAISVIGDSSTEGSTTGTGTGSTDGITGGSTSGDDGILGGTQVTPVVQLPINLGGNAIAVIGDTTTGGPTTGGGTTDPTDPVNPTDPTDPVTPVDPTDPTDGAVSPNEVEADGSSTSDGVISIAAAGDISAADGSATGSDSLATTGTESGLTPLALALLLLTAGLGLLVRRRPLRR